MSKPKFKQPTRYKPKPAPAQDDMPCAYTADGRKIRIRAISMMEVEEARQNITAEYAGMTAVPTYVVTTAGGAMREHPLNAEILDVDGDEVETARRQTAWQAYTNAVSAMEREISKATLTIIMDGIDEQPESAEWIQRRKRLHLGTPGPDDSEEDVLTFWKLNVLLRNNMQDILDIQQEIITLSLAGAVDRETIAAAMGTFPDSLSGQPEEAADPA